MTSLRDHIIERIHTTGPMRIDEYMAMCLLHPTRGYYTTRDPFGAEGDFVTAPEISQMFGELIGLCLAQTWLSQGAPARFTLAELGPGRGILMADILRATRAVPGFAQAAEITLVEASQTLRDVQRTTLAGHQVQWCDSADALPDQPLYLVANEFFDALPIRQFVRDGTGWRERQIGLTDGALSFGLGPMLPQPAFADRLEDTQDGDLIEDCAQLAPTVQAIANRISTHGGAALIIDYGDWRSLGDTFQALRGHQTVDPLSAPGSSDLTAHVDFEKLAIAAAPAQHSRITPQGVFLERLGITQRAQTLATTMTGKVLEGHVAAHRRLTHPSEMGNLFKVIGLFPPTQNPPPGLDP
ncbi:class I SAM-dependent methyltransferase [Roseobacter sp. GAI101]|uniref:class I SAM-dependent methyltransferase n=1 Tax=Roseobacter sp. (strain GAI101) TaxID=391589 RepID=UPI00018724C2|nr:SAM-dependent methyltransferase [Roseobacter sp. GAI101]EEB83908.1 ATP synthase beta subunit/transription termination factor rho [Roseobacter sp. GAI101]